MSLYLPIRRGASSAIAICGRCKMKIYHAELVKDPNTGLMVCSKCCDIKDPWTQPARKTENMAINNPRPDEELV